MNPDRRVQFLGEDPQSSESPLLGTDIFTVEPSELAALKDGLYDYLNTPQAESPDQLLQRAQGAVSVLQSWQSQIHTRWANTHLDAAAFRDLKNRLTLVDALLFQLASMMTGMELMSAVRKPSRSPLIPR